MTLKLFVPACALLGIVAFCSFEAERKLDRVESAFSAASEPDFPPDRWKNASATTWGQTLRISSGGTMTESEIRAIGQSIGRRYRANNAWVEEFLEGYRRTPDREHKAQ